MVKISVVIVSFNSSKFIKSCLDSVYGQDYNDYEVIVVDNGSRDGTGEFIKQHYSEVILIENKSNLGACRARNQGIEVSRGEWVLTLDCDVVLSRGFFLSFIKTIDNLPEKTGIVQPKIFDSDRKTIYSCGIYLSWFRRFYDVGKGIKENGQFSESKNIFGACSAAAFYKRKMLEEIKEDTGYFDERFFFLVEDVDLAWRAQRRRWKSLFFPQAGCYHIGNSSKTNKKLRQYLCFRNRYYTIIKNESFIKYAAKVFPMLFYDLPRTIGGYFTNAYFWKRKGFIVFDRCLKKQD